MGVEKEDAVDNFQVLKQNGALCSKIIRKMLLGVVLGTKISHVTINCDVNERKRKVVGAQSPRSTMYIIPIAKRWIMNVIRPATAACVFFGCISTISIPKLSTTIKSFKFLKRWV